MNARTMISAATGTDAALGRHGHPEVRRAQERQIILIGASTGGTEAIKVLLPCMPPDCPGILIVQHMPEAFTRSFAERLDGLCRISVRVARDGERVLPGHAYIAPGHAHLLLKPWVGGYVTALADTPPVNRHRPSVDVLFRSGAACAGEHAIGVLLTGMGKDGAAGLLEMRRAGAATYAQDEASCVVFGMPKEAIAMGGARAVVPIADLARRVLEGARVKGEGMDRSRSARSSR